MHNGTTNPLLDDCTRVLLELRWGDMDAYGHVNNVTQMQLLEEARVRALGSPTQSRDAVAAPGAAEVVSGTPMPEVFGAASATTELLVASHAVEYRSPIGYRPGPIAVDLVSSDVSPASVTIGSVGVEPGGSRVYTVAETVIAFVDRTTGRPRRLTEEEAAELSGVVREPVRLRSLRR